MSVRNQGQRAPRRGTPRRQSARAVRRARLRTSLVCAVASLSLIAQAAVIAHALLVPHTTCLEHGAVSHEAGHAHDADASRVHESPPVASNPAASVRAADAPALEDEHCGVLGTRHTPASRVFEALLTEFEAPTTTPAPVEAPAMTSAPARYRLAPKTSPPHA